MPASAAAVLPRPPTLCAECDRVIPLHTGVGEFACECGAVHGHHINEDAEYRCFADEEGQEEKKRAEAYTREDEIGAPMAAGLASTDKMRRWADGRINQVKQMLAHLVREEPGRAVLSDDEYRAALMLCRAAAFHQASLPEDSAEQQTASALFWAIALAQNVAARRPGGWFVDSEPAAAAWGMDALSEYISCFQSESYVTAERLGNATRARGGVARAAALVHDAKRRKLRIDSLGSAEARRTKLLALEALLVAAGCDGLHARVMQHRAWHKPCWRPLASPPPREPGPRPAAPALRPLTCLRLALSQEPRAAAGSRAAPSGPHASLPGGAGEPVGRADCAAARRSPCLWKAGERPPRAGESRTRQDQGRTLEGRRSFSVPHVLCAERCCAQCRPNRPHSNHPNSNLAQAKPPGALTAARASCALRPRPSPPPAHSDDHARRTPAAVAPLVVAGGDGAGGAQVSEPSAMEEPDTDTETEMSTTGSVSGSSDAETDAEMSELESELERQLGAGPDASDEDTMMSEDGSDWEGGDDDVQRGECGGATACSPTHEPVAEPQSSDISASDLAFLKTLDLRARTPRNLAPAQAGTRSVKVPIGKRRLRAFLSSSSSAHQGMKARAQEARHQAEEARRKEAEAQKKEEDRLAAEAQRRAREEAARVAAEEAAAAREFNATMRLGAKVELAQARGGSVSVATDPLKIHILQFVKPICLPRSAEADVKTVRLKLSGERTLVRLPTPSAPLKRAAVAEANPYCKAFKVRERGASASSASASTSA